MVIIYILLILLAAFPLGLTIWRMRRAAFIKKTGIHTNGYATSIRTVRIKSSLTDVVSIEYKDRATGLPYPGKATTEAGKFRVGDTIGVVYLPANPAKYAIADTRGGFTALLIFCIILFLCVLFAVYKINGMVQRGEM
ncbi:MAG: DUF3592 domain-containing protein [Chitinophagaceae bacterium]